MVDHIANSLTHSLQSALHISEALCVIKGPHGVSNPGAQDFLLSALHSAMISAEAMRQAWQETLKEEEDACE